MNLTRGPTPSFAAVAAAVVLLAACGCLAQHQAGGPAFFVAPVIPTVDMPIRITMYGKNFSQGTAFRLTQNTTQCNEGTVYSPTVTPPGTLSNIVRWNKHDPSTFLVATFHVGQPGHMIRVCYTRDGQRWFMAKNNRDRKHFHLWRTAPKVTAITPITPTVGQPLYLRVPGLQKFSIAALTTRADGCDGDKVANAIKGGNSSVYHKPTETFAFTPREAASRVYLCVAEAPTFTAWALVPFDPTRIVQNENRVSGHTGRLPLEFGPIAIVSATTRGNRGNLVCGAFVEGAVVTCRLTLVNKTTLALVASDVSFSVLKDGGGVNECPFPTITQSPRVANEVEFRWTPQRFGRGGEIGFNYRGKPLFLRPTAWNTKWYAFGNITRKPLTSSMIDDSFLRFVVAPGFSQLHSYPYASLTDLQFFAPNSQWVFARGTTRVYGGYNDSAVRTASLRPGLSTATMSKVVTIPAGSTSCKANLKFLYSADSGAMQQLSDIIGAVRVSRDATAMLNVEIYATGASVAIVGHGRRQGLVDGDMRAWETLGVEMPVDTSVHTSITLALTAYQPQYTGRIFYSDVELRCSSAVRTPAPEVAALKRLYNYIGSASPTVQSWKVGGNFNGDPCANHWKGVSCRNMHVVALDLSQSGLSGTMPQVPELIWLERLRLNNNNLGGAVPSHLANLTRLRHVDLSNNRFTSVPAAVFSYKSHACLASLLLRNNALTRYPDQLQHMRKIEHLDLAFNSMVSNVPDFSPALPLVHLDLSHNFLIGKLPALPVQTLVSADFSRNRFNGTVPGQWSTLQRLEFLDVSKNQLTGKIPHELSKIRSGAFLTFRGEENFFTGLLPNLGFRVVDVRDNIFACPLPKGEAFILTSHVGSMETMQCDRSQIVRPS